MPIYEYWCHDCKRKVSILWPSADAADRRTAACPECDSSKLTKLVSRVSYLRSEEARLESLADPDQLAGLDEEDPRAMARWMRQMGDAVGEDLGDEFDEVVDRLEAGEDPESVEDSMAGAFDEPGQES